MKIYIYILSHPITNEIKYVGKTNSIKRRLQGHIDYARNPKKKRRYVSYWILKLLKEDLRPILTVLEECDDTNWIERERYWINFYKNQSCKLCNLTEGGEGTHGYEYPEYLKEIRKNARLGWNFPEDVKNKISNSLKRKVKCVTDNIVFDSVKEATLYSKSSPTTFITNLKKGKLIKGKYYEYI